MALRTPVPSLRLLDEPSLMNELNSSRDTMDLAAKHISKKVCEWYESWRPWQQRMLLCGLTDRCSKAQLEALATTLEPVYHRDFVTTVRQRYPSAPFRHQKMRQEQKQKRAEQAEQKLASVFRDDYHTRFPETMPLLHESDMALFNSLVGETANALTDPADTNSISEFSSQLSARLIVGAMKILKSRHDLPNKNQPAADASSSPNVVMIEDSSSRCTSDDMFSLAVSNASDLTDSDQKLPMIAEEPSLLQRSPEHMSTAESSPSPEAVTSSPTDDPPPATISDPLRNKPKRNKNKETTPVLDLPPLKVIEHRHRSAIGTASDVATVDFFLGERTEKLGFMQREMRRGPVKKPTSLQDVMLPLQKCYKHVKLCSDDKPYVKAHRGRLRGHFGRQLKQVWNWIKDWQDHEKLSLLSDVAKLCNSAMIQYLGHCLTIRLRDRIDTDSLPDHIMLEILQHLDYADINNASAVCSRWRYLCNLDRLWQRKCKQIGQIEGVPNINHIIVKTRRKSKQIDWKLAYQRILRICEEARDVRPIPSRAESTPEGMVRINGKLYPIEPSEDGSSIDERHQRRRLTVSEVLPVKRGTIFYLRDQGLDFLEEDDDEESYLGSNEYAILRDDDEKSKKSSRRRQRPQSTYGSSFDVSGRTRYEHTKDTISEEEEGATEQTGTKAVKRKKRRHEEEEPALDIRPELRQARDLLNANVPRRSLIWKDSNRAEAKQKSAKFAGQVKSVQRVRKLQGHLDAVLCIAISKRRMISGSMDRSIRIWDLHTGKSIHKFYGHMGGVRCLHFEGTILVSGSWDMQAMVWDLVKFDRLAVLSGHRGSISCVEFNERYLVTASHDKTVRVYCMRAFDLHGVIKGHSKEITAMKLDGRNVVTASSDKTVRITNIDLSQCIRVFQLQEHIVSLCLQNDLLIVGNGLGQCHFLNKQTGVVEAGVETHKSAVNQVLIHGNRFFTCSSDSMVKEWDLVTMTCVRYLQGPRGPIRDLKVDDRRIISCGDDGNIRIWDMHIPENQRQSTSAGGIVPSTIVKTNS